MFFKKKENLPSPENALPGRSKSMEITGIHHVLKTSMKGPFSQELSSAIFAMGCFWGAERKFWSLKGVYTTAVGYIAGITENPTYEEVCSGLTGHTEAVLVVYDESVISFSALLKVFWESHNPTQGMRQGNDIGTQYRSGIYLQNETKIKQAINSKRLYQEALKEKGLGEITSEILLAKQFYYAEEYHQQYLAKNPNGYCGLGGCGVSLPE